MKKVQIKKSVRKGKNKVSVVKPHTRSIKKPKKTKPSEVVKNRIGLSKTKDAQSKFKENIKSIVHKSLG